LPDNELASKLDNLTDEQFNEVFKNINFPNDFNDIVGDTIQFGNGIIED
jgi:hypothetical protein